MNDRPSTQAIRLGMVAWHALPAIIPTLGTSIGGLETGAWTLARGLSEFTNIQPQFFVRTTRRRIPDAVDGVVLVPDYQPLANIRRQVSDAIAWGPPLKLRHFRVGLLWQIPLLAAARLLRHSSSENFHAAKPGVSIPAVDSRLLSAQVDVWAGFGVNTDTAKLAATAIAQQRPMILFLESNADLDPRIAAPAETFNAYGESSHMQRFALQHASLIVCQSEFQQQQLKAIFERSGVLLRNPIEPSHWLLQPTIEKRDRHYVLWIGRYDTFHKRPHLALQIARLAPQLRFRLIVNRHDPLVESEIRNSLPKNVELVDYVPFDKMPLEFARAQAFLCTGSPEHEGFPNVLLQSAAAHTPIVSLHDFDTFLQRSGAGAIVGSSPLEAATMLTRVAASDSIAWTQVDRFIETHYSVSAIALQTAAEITKLLANRTGAERSS